MPLRLDVETEAVSREVADGALKRQRMTRDGIMFTAPWKLAQVMEGRGHHVTVGAFSTPIVGGGAGTVIDLDQPECVISVPSGKAILPIRVHVQTQAPLIAADSDESEILIAVDRTAANAGDGTATSETIYNMRTDNPSGYASSCTAKSAYTADTTDPSLDIELARSVMVADVQNTASNALSTKHELLYEPETPPIIVGPAQLIVYWGGTVATSGFAEVQWLEVPTTDFVA